MSNPLTSPGDPIASESATPAPIEIPPAYAVVTPRSWSSSAAVSAYCRKPTCSANAWLLDNRLVP